MSLLYFLIFLIVGLALDWALYERIVTILGQGWESNSGYSDFLYPRVVLTLIAIVVCFFAPSDGAARAVVVILASGAFIISTGCGAYRYLRGEDLRL